MPLAALGVADAVLLGAHAAERHRIDEFQWLGLKHSDRCTLWPPAVLPVAAVAQVILHVAAAEVQFGIDVGELAEDLAAGSCP